MTRTTPAARRAVPVLLALAALLALVVPAGAAEIGLAAFRNSTGISHHPLAASNFDGGGFSYSRAALLLANVQGGTVIQHDGLSYTWPSTQPGQADNVEMDGQLIPVIPGAATRIGFLGASHNGPITADVILHYTRVVDGERRDVRVEAPLTFSDWTLNANTRPPAPGNATVITTRFRVNGTTVEQVPAHVFATQIPIDPSMTLQSIQLPDQDKLHIFGLALG